MRPSVSLHVTTKDLRHASRILRSATALVSGGVVGRVVVTGLARGESAEIERPGRGVAFVRMPSIFRRFPRFLLSQAIKEVERTVRVCTVARRLRPAVVTARSAWDLPASWLAARSVGAALVYEPHELESGRNGMTWIRSRIVRAIERVFGRRAGACVAVGNRIAEHYSAQLRIPCFTVFNVPAARPAASVPGLRHRAGISPGDRVLAYVGALVEGRGLADMAEAVRVSSTPWRLVAMGPGPLADALARGPGGRCTVIDPVPAPEVVGAIADADLSAVLIEPICESYRLCMPNKLFESLSAGVPVIASDLPELGDFVREHGVGTLVAPGSGARAIADALDSLTDEQLAGWREAIPRALGRASPEAGAATLVCAYRTAMERRRS